MKTLADIKKAMVEGSVWSARNVRFGFEFGFRSVVECKKSGVWFESTSTRGESFFKFPKRADVEFTPTGFKVLDSFAPGSYLLEYVLIETA